MTIGPAALPSSWDGAPIFKDFDQVPSIFLKTHQSPPTGNNQTTSFDSLKGLEMCQAGKENTSTLDQLTYMYLLILPWMGRILCKLAPLVLAAPVDVVAQQVHGSDGGEGCPGKRRGNTN